MRVTIKGQVTVPLHVRKKLNITPGSEIDFVETRGRFYIARKSGKSAKSHKFSKLRGIGTVRMSTDEIMALTRNDA